MKPLTRRLKSQSALKGYSQRYMAKRLKISETAYSLKETLKTEFTLREINIMLDLFNCKFEELFGGE